MAGSGEAGAGGGVAEGATDEEAALIKVNDLRSPTRCGRNPAASGQRNFTPALWAPRGIAAIPTTLDPSRRAMYPWKVCCGRAIQLAFAIRAGADAAHSVSSPAKGDCSLIGWAIASTSFLEFTDWKCLNAT